MSKLKKISLFLGDIALLYASLFLALIIRYQGQDILSRFRDHMGPFSIIFLIWLLVFYVANLYKHGVFRNRVTLLGQLLTAIFVAALISIVVFYVFSGIFELTPKTNLFLFCAIFLALDYLFRSTLLGLFHAGAVDIVILGDSPLIQEMVSYLKDNPQTGYKAAEWFQSFDNEKLKNLFQTIKNGGVELVVAQPKLVNDPKTTSALYELLPLGINLMNFSDFYELIFERVPLEELEEGWFIEHIAPNRPIYDRAKRMLDLGFAGIIGLILLPVALLIAVFIKLTSRGPIIYKQERSGRNGKIFTLYKFRSMADGHQGPLWTEANDRRITGVGRVIRFTHLDEIPQLWNIFRGNLSFTGPRPEAVGLAEKYSRFPYYEIRHVVAPGLTGWAQINYRPSASLEEAYEKLKYDIYYVQNRSFLLDLLIILKTIKYFFTTHE